MRTRFIWILTAALCCSLMGTFSTSSARLQPAENTDEIVIEIFDLYYWVEWFGIPADTDVNVKFVNRGAIEHTFNVDELGIDLRIAPGGEEQIVINAPAGIYEFYCNSPGHRDAGMFGMLRVGDEPEFEGPGPEGALPEGAGEAPRPVPTDEVVAISVNDSGFDPRPRTLAALQPYVLRITNEGTKDCNFSIDALGIAVDIAAGTTEEVPLIAPLGDYLMHCDRPGEAYGVISTVESPAEASPVVPDLSLVPACEGMAEYQAAMDEVISKGPFEDPALTELAHRYGTAINLYSQEGDASGLSAEEWLTLAEAFESSRLALEAITPPEFASAWHENQIDGANLWVAFFRAFAEGNPPSLDEFDRDFERLLDDGEAARLSAVAVCPHFGEWAPPVYRD